MVVACPENRYLGQNVEVGIASGPIPVPCDSGCAERRISLTLRGLSPFAPFRWRGASIPVPSEGSISDLKTLLPQPASACGN